jgi:hypothetical protein
VKQPRPSKKGQALKWKGALGAAAAVHAFRNVKKKNDDRLRTMVLPPIVS